MIDMLTYTEEKHAGGMSSNCLLTEELWKEAQKIGRNKERPKNTHRVKVPL